jgi:Na+-transporting NADH:ubiquinone oxidoreductase subunit NqrB
MGKALLSLIAIITLLAIGFVAGWIIPWTVNVFGATLWPNHIIPYTWETAVAGLVIILVFAPRVTVKKS